MICGLYWLCLSMLQFEIEQPLSPWHSYPVKWRALNVVYKLNQHSGEETRVCRGMPVWGQMRVPECADQHNPRLREALWSALYTALCTVLCTALCIALCTALCILWTSAHVHHLSMHFGSQVLEQHIFLNNRKENVHFSRCLTELLRTSFIISRDNIMGSLSFYKRRK